MKKILKRFIKRKVFALACPFGKEYVSDCVEFVTEAPVWQWHYRLWLIKRDTGLDFNLYPPQPEATISGWVARDKSGSLFLYEEKPWRFGDRWKTDEMLVLLETSDFPSLTWQDEPMEVVITIKPKKQ